MRPMLRSYGILLLLFAVILLLSVMVVSVYGSEVFDARLVIGANLVFFLVSAFSLRLQQKAVAHANPHVFVRAILSSMFLKMMITAIALLLYVRRVNPHYTMISVWAAMGVYLCYLVAGVNGAVRLNRKKP